MILFRTFHCLKSSNEIREVFFAKQTDLPIIAAGYYRRFGDDHAQQQRKEAILISLPFALHPHLPTKLIK
jgi:hypothetical protein